MIRMETWGNFKTVWPAISIIPIAILILLFNGCTNHQTRELSVEEYQEAVYASWIGQIIGNTYGLCYEFQHIDEPGPDAFPYGYTWTLEELAKYDGAFSDDDTDIEYMYLTRMEKHGIEPDYGQLADAWKTHVKERVWAANRAALTLMHAGHYPPVTGNKHFNVKWSQIDPQLVNEIWAVTAPGMINYAVDKSEFAARITNDSFGIEPTLHYAAMYSSAFFVKDIEQLIEIGLSALPANSRFARIVEHVKELHRTYPNNWQQARSIVKERYYDAIDYNPYAWKPIDANLNGALGIMALLYGEGDFQKTLDFACAFGMDADNQAATMCGLLGIVHGLDGIPKNLMYPLEDAGWDEPFNDLYKMVTRDQMEDASLTGLAKRMAAQGEQIILAYGGEKVQQGGESFYRINSDATFIPPFELNPIPPQFVEVDRKFSYPIYTGGSPGNISVSIDGKLPDRLSLQFENGRYRISGVPEEPGNYHFSIHAEHGSEKKTIEVDMTVHTKNLATSAAEILFNEHTVDKNISLINDGSTAETYYSIKSGDQRETDFYGYRWKEPQKIRALSYNNGLPQEFGGWFTSFDVQYLENGQWVPVENLAISPEINLDNSQWLKPSFMAYAIRFQPVETHGIRITGKSGGIPKDEANAHLGMQYYTSIAELRVFEE